MKLQAVLVITALSVMGCIDQAQEVVDVDPNVDGGADLGSQIDTGSSDTGSSDTGSPGDTGVDADPISLPASDVSNQLEALWTFEGGVQSEVNGYELGPISIFADGSAPQGQSQLRVDADEATATNGDLGRLAVGAQLLVGGWVRSESSQVDSNVISRYAPESGGWVVAIDRNMWACTGATGDGSGDFKYVTSNIPEVESKWAHVACLFERNELGITITTYVDGLATNSAPSVYAEGGGAFRLGQADGAFRFAGSIDEVFVGYPEELALELVRRIYACGVDGRLCTCRAQAPGSYEDCGRLGSDCSILPPCRIRP